MPRHVEIALISVRTADPTSLHQRPALQLLLKLQLIGLPVSLIVMASLLSAMLPTTFGGGLLVAICQIIVSLLIVGVIVAVMMAVAAAA